MNSMVSNLGGKVEVLIDWATDPNELANNQEKAWNLIRKAIDEGKPCFVFGFGMPEYYIIYGYDDTGYYASGSGCDRGAGPIPWKDLGKSSVGVLDVHCISLVPAADAKKTVKDALQLALELAQNPNKSIYPGYIAGLAGYDSWIKSTESGKASPLGMSFITLAWLECRKLGVQFLKEAARRLDGSSIKPLEEAAEHYEVVARQLQMLTQLFPYPYSEPIEDKELIKKTVNILKNARDAEEFGLKALEKVVAVL